MITSYHMIDLVVFIIANMTNLLLTVMFFLRARGRPKIGFYFGLFSVALGIPLAVVGIANLLGGRPWWTVVLPGLLVLYDTIEFLLDYVLKFDFRHSLWLVPYLCLYYLALMGMIVYSFIVRKPFGYITLVTYFINLAATAYSFSRVGHQ